MPADALPASLDRLLEPLVRILLRHGVAHGAFAELAKHVYVRVAEAEERLAGRRQTTSRMSLLTGLTRKEVARLRPLAQRAADDESTRYHRAARVVTGWIRDERYGDGSGQPRPLAFDGDGATFSDLAKRYSGDVPPRAVLDELERVGTVVAGEDGRIHLRERAYLPNDGDAEKLEILGADVAGLISTIRHNLDAPQGERRLQRKVFYDNLPADCLPALRALAAAEGQALLERLDRWMAAQDLDDKPDANSDSGHRAGIGIFYFEEPEDDGS